MRLFHTSDLHLREDRPERLQALKEIMRVADEWKIDILTIGGARACMHATKEPSLQHEKHDFESDIKANNLSSHKHANPN